MKILMLTWEYPPRIVGGIARVVNDLSKRMIKDRTWCMCNYI